MATSSADKTSTGDSQLTASEDDAIHPSLKLTVPVLLRTKEQLIDQLVNHEAVLQTSQMALSQEEDVEKILESVESLQKELHTVVTDLAQKELLLKRLQLSHTLLEVLYPPNGVQEDEEEQTRNELKTLVLKQCELVSQVLAVHKETQELRPKLEEILGRKFEYIKENRKLMSKLKDKEESQKNKAKKFSQNKEVQLTREKVEKSIWRTELQRNTLQGLVLGSGVNWAQDEELTEMLLSLGQPFNM